MDQKHKRVSLVIPAYNEELQLKNCLDCIAAQSVKPFEVIVVDNNSTDQTRAIAGNYSFVKLISEKRQGVVFARDTGFDATTGDIIGRIDVETRLPQNWVALVQKDFETMDIDGVSGSLQFHDVPFPKFFGAVDLFFRRYLATCLNWHNQLFLYGGNMAITSESWQIVRKSVCHNLKLHEDLDLSAHMSGGQFKICFDDELEAAISARRVDSDFKTYCHYVLANSRTYLHHNLISRLYMYPVIWFVILFYLPLRMLYRSYDHTNQRFSLRQLLSSPYEQRVSPISE